MKTEIKARELSEDEKLVLNLLKDQTGLSNKNWDNAIKGLTKNKLATVEKTDRDFLYHLHKILNNRKDE